MNVFLPLVGLDLLLFSYSPVQRSTGVLNHGVVTLQSPGEPCVLFRQNLPSKLHIPSSTNILSKFSLLRDADPGDRFLLFLQHGLVLQIKT